MNISNAMFLIDSQNYTDREIDIIYGRVKELPENEFYDLLDKCTDEYHDWRIFDFLTKKYIVKGQLAILK